ncbi:hypothetical protein CARUB_v10002542mg [Capsella rubella]|uniref:Prolamin-like domain-containing protein n=1 Tax=Capsella rubella TaxID=81985 RepID=R0GYQ8_9BRAS|nr:uncharacterized protein LOC17883104 [Capsella rubella]EOA22019.1 hypothetical protein CARUB_v10002542mg [Capsella rubella]
METKQMKEMFFFSTLMVALLCSHQSEAQPPVPSPDECFSPIKKVKGCLDAVKAVTEGDFKGLGKDCCHAINGLADDCLSILSPGKPYIGHCITR